MKPPRKPRVFFARQEMDPMRPGHFIEVRITDAKEVKRMRNLNRKR